MAAPLVTVVMPADLHLSRQVITPNSGRVIACDRLDLVVTRDQAHQMADAFSDLADDLDRAGARDRHPARPAVPPMPADILMKACPTCHGKGGFDDETDEGVPFWRGCYGGCLDGVVFRSASDL